MSERQAKKKKTGEVLKEEKKASGGSVLFNVIAGVVILAFSGLAVWGIIQSKGDDATIVTPNVDTTYEEFDDTLGTMAEQEGLTFEEFAEKYALSLDTFGPTSTYTDSIDIFTLETISKLEGHEDLSKYIEEKGLPEDVNTKIPNAELPTGVMMKVYGFQETFDELKPYGIPEDMTEDTRWIDAKDYVLNAEQVKVTSGMTSQNNGGAE